MSKPAEFKAAAVGKGREPQRDKAAAQARDAALTASRARTRGEPVAPEADPEPTAKTPAPKTPDATPAAPTKKDA